MAQVESSFHEFTSRNVSVVFIAAQKIDGLFRGKEHIETHTYPFPLLFDETRQVTRAYGVHHAIGMDAYNIARRAMFLLNREGKISWIAVSPHQFEAPPIPEVIQAIEACDKC